jgi:hypothetical protein
MEILNVLGSAIANRGDDKPRDDLKEINAHYFGPDVVGDISLHFSKNNGSSSHQ